MEFRAEQTFQAPAEAVARAYADPALYVALGGAPRLGAPEVVAFREERGIVHLDVRQHFTGRLAPAVTAIVDPARLTWVEQTVHDLGRLEVEFRLAPEHYADRLRAGGRCSYRQDGGRTRRIVTGEVVVSGVPLFGRAVERAIVSGLQEHLAAEVPLAQRFLDQKAAGPPGDGSGDSS